MSLLDQARAIATRKSSRDKCTVANDLSKFDPDLIPEIRELLAERTIPATTVLEVLGENGPVHFNDDNLSTKRRQGCKCTWCVETEIWPV